MIKSEVMLLTGASGFIGSAFLRYALNLGWPVRALTRSPSSWSPQGCLEIVEGDFSRNTDWSRVLEGVKYVVHSAAEIRDPALMPAVNVFGPQLMLEKAVDRGVKRWVQLSSVGSYGPVRCGVVNEDWPDNPSDPYEVSKTNFDDILKKASRVHGIETCIVRPSNVYGQGMRNQSIQQLHRAIQKNYFAFIGPEGASANYVHVQDVVQALELCVTHPRAANQTYIVSAWTSMEEMVSGLSEGAGLITPSRRIPLPVATMLARAMQWWPGFPLTLRRVRAMSLRSRYSTQKIERELGWKLMIPVKEGVFDCTRDLCQLN